MFNLNSHKKKLLRFSCSKERKCVHRCKMKNSDKTTKKTSLLLITLYPALLFIIFFMFREILQSPKTVTPCSSGETYNSLHCNETLSSMSTLFVLNSYETTTKIICTLGRVSKNKSKRKVNRQFLLLDDTKKII